MATKILSFNGPLNPLPNANNNQSVLKTGDGWTLTVKKTAASREINVTYKTLAVSMTSSHYSAFCVAFHGGAGVKTVTATYNNGIVQSIKWDNSTVQLPDGGSFAPIAGMASPDMAEDNDDIDTMRK